MQSSSYVIGILGITGISFAAFILTLIFINPETTGLGGIAIFYASLFGTSLGIFALAGITLRRIFTRRYVQVQHIRSSIRHSVELSGLLVLLLAFQSMGMYELYWGLGALFLILGVELLIARNPTTN